jgi:hypothetical protein
MLTVLGRPRRCCDGLSRRELLQAGALSLFGSVLTTPHSRLHAASSQSSVGRVKSVLLLDLFGGPSHLDTFDLKPEAPAEIRGTFKPIATSLPGLRVCEHLPRLAKWMHRMAVVRTVSHAYNSHNPYAVMTGFTGGSDREDYFAKPSNHPGMGAVCQYLGVGRRRDLPGYVILPAMPGYSQGLRRAGPYGGYLGALYDPVFAVCAEHAGNAIVDDKDAYNHKIVPRGEPRLPPLPADVTVNALDSRRTLLQQIDERAHRLCSGRMELMTYRQQQAFQLLTSPAARRAFDLSREPAAVRDRYGRDTFGASVLLARRLVEAGVTFITVHTETKGPGHWDTHENNFNLLQHLLLPFLDRALTSLLSDLSERGLLQSTLVVVTGDMGRAPRINGKAGRDHWPQCGFCLFAGGGVKEGAVHGASDRIGAFPTEHPVSPGDLVATIYERLGIDTETTVPDQVGRPINIAHGGQPIRTILA